MTESATGEMYCAQCRQISIDGYYSWDYSAGEGRPLCRSCWNAKYPLLSSGIPGDITPMYNIPPIPLPMKLTVTKGTETLTLEGTPSDVVAALKLWLQATHVI